MASDFEVKGADQFLRLSKALKEAGDTETRKALHKALRDVVNEVKPEAAKALADALPSGLRARGAKVKQAIQVKTGRDPGVSVAVRYGKAGSGLGAVNAKQINRKGTFRHPVWKTGSWAEQSTKGGAGWFDKTYENAAPQMRDGLEQAIEHVADDIVKKAR
jgi:hypothetical protein